ERSSGAPGRFFSAAPQSEPARRSALTTASSEEREPREEDGAVARISAVRADVAARRFGGRGRGRLLLLRRRGRIVALRRGSVGAAAAARLRVVARARRRRRRRRLRGLARTRKNAGGDPRALDRVLLVLREADVGGGAERRFRGVLEARARHDV